MPTIKNTRVTYSPDNDANYYPFLKDEVEIEQEVVVKLNPSPNYQLGPENGTSVVTRIKMTQKIVIPDDFKAKFKIVYVITGDNQEIRNLPVAPDHTEWQFASASLNENNYQFGQLILDY